MLAWINIQLPMYRITNFSGDWNNGKAICGLVDQIKLGVCKDHMGLDKTNGLENCILGMDLAEKHLKVLSYPDYGVSLWYLLTLFSRYPRLYLQPTSTIL